MFSTRFIDYMFYKTKPPTTTPIQGERKSYYWLIGGVGVVLCSLYGLYSISCKKSGNKEGDTLVSVNDGNYILYYTYNNKPYTIIIQSEQHPTTINNLNVQPFSFAVQEIPPYT